jgi:hypothetical protein
MRKVLDLVQLLIAIPRYFSLPDTFAQRTHYFLLPKYW